MTDLPTMSMTDGLRRNRTRSVVVSGAEPLANQSGIHSSPCQKSLVLRLLS